MSSIQANITIDLPDGVEADEYLQSIQEQLTKMNGKQTQINVIEVDDPLSLSPIHLRKLKA